MSSQHPKCVTFKAREEDEEEEGKEEDARMGGRSNTNNSEEDEEADEVKNHTSTTNPIFDQAVENAKKTETEMEIWIANATNASVTRIDEVVSAIEDVATSGHFNVSSSSSSDETNKDSTTVVPVVQELQNDLEAEEEKKFETLRNVPEFRYRSALGGASTSDFSGSSIPSASKSAMLLHDVNEYDRKDFFVFGTLSMAFCVAFFVAVVLRKHAQKFKVVATGEETTSEEEEEEEEEEEGLMRNEYGKIKYGSVV